MKKNLENSIITLDMGDDVVELKKGLEHEEDPLLEPGTYVATITKVGKESQFAQYVLGVTYDVETDLGILELKDLLFINAEVELSDAANWKLRQFLLAVYDGKIPANPKVKEDPIGLNGYIELEIKTSQKGREYNNVIAWDFSGDGENAAEVDDIEFDEE